MWHKFKKDLLQEGEPYYPQEYLSYRAAAGYTIQAENQLFGEETSLHHRPIFNRPIKFYVTIRFM